MHRLMVIVPISIAVIFVLLYLAFVLKLTRRVKEEMTADRAPTQLPCRKAEGALVA